MRQLVVLAAGMAMSAPPPASSLELIRYNAQSDKFELGQAALLALRSVKGPVGVVAVCGRARQGKSFILNQLLQTSGGFQVGPTHRPCTKGLWMWSAPIKQRAEDGSEHHLVLLDTEGIDAYDQVRSRRASKCFTPRLNTPATVVCHRSVLWPLFEKQ